MSTTDVLWSGSALARLGGFVEPSRGVGELSRDIHERLKSITEPTPTFSGSRVSAAAPGIDERLYDALASFKIWTAAIAMHLDRDWRTRLFRQLDSLLDSENWEKDDPPPKLASFSTFLRMLLWLRPDRRPGLGASGDGNLIAAWTVGEDRLTIECLDNDTIRWHLAVTIEGERERAAGITPLKRLTEVLAPYGPERWFVGDADNLRT